ncbi:family 20 glycosylhydrolase [Streptomyces sp. NA04227]|nr:family 20 glycosylhydrolase [Streptomyces sp. NA04227]
MGAAALTVTATPAAARALPSAATPTGVPEGRVGDTAPVTIPALQEWRSAASGSNPGSYTLRPESRLLLAPGAAERLHDEARLFVDELAERSGIRVPVVTAVPSAARTGDLTLTLAAPNSRLGKEGYTLTAGRTLDLAAPTAHGVFHATRTVLQLLADGAAVPAGSAVDRPRKPERGLMLDVGRKYFSPGWLRQQIDEMAYLKLNHLHLHLSDDLGFRVESERHPEIVSAQHYTKAEITDLVAYAARRHITVMPEIDMPGHLAPVLAAHPELQLRDKDGKAPKGFIDLTQPAAYALLKDLIDEYAALFPDSPWFHIGADEYVTDYAAFPQLAAYAKEHYGPRARAADTYYGFVNWADGIVRSHGKTTRMWNDGIHADDGTLAPRARIHVENWSRAGITPQALADRGHTLTNESRSWTYYVLGRYKPPTTRLYEDWHPDLFDNGGTLTDPARNRGSALHVWCDNPAVDSEQQVAGGLVKPLRVLAQQLWGSPRPVRTYAEYQQVIGAVGHAPGWPVTAPRGDLAAHRPVAVSSVEPVLSSDGTISGVEQFSGLNAVDGEPGTRWSSLRTDPQWLRIDLGTAHRVGSVRLTWESAYAKAYQVQVSDNGTDWTTLRTVTDGRGGTESLNGLAGKGRYVRLLLAGRGTSYGYSLYGVEVYKEDVVP